MEKFTNATAGQSLQRNIYWTLTSWSTIPKNRRAQSVVKNSLLNIAWNFTGKMHTWRRTDQWKWFSAQTIRDVSTLKKDWRFKYFSSFSSTDSEQQRTFHLWQVWKEAFNASVIQQSHLPGSPKSCVSMRFMPTILLPEMHLCGTFHEGSPQSAQF